jgi:PAS domain S-box-containing protein
MQDTSEIRERIRRHAELFDTHTQAVIGTTVPGSIVYWNTAAERLYGWAAAEVEGRSILEVTPTMASLAQAEEILHRLQQGRSWSGAFTVQSRSGDSFRVSVTDVPVVSETGDLLGLVGISSRA